MMSVVRKADRRMTAGAFLLVLVSGVSSCGPEPYHVTEEPEL